MAIIMGPVLKFVGLQDDLWQVSALIVVDDAPDAHGAFPNLSLAYEHQDMQPAQSIEARRIHDHAGRYALRFDMTIPRVDAERKVTYRIPGAFADSFSFFIPGKNKQLSFAYASCNGFSEPGLMKDVNDHFALWDHLLKTAPEAVPNEPATHTHLLIMGGDQIYADSIWLEKQELGDWSTQPNAEANAHELTPGMKAEFDDFFFDLYVKRWAHPRNGGKHSAQAMASIPTVMMWDDHDIIDGWGSYSEERNNCAVFKELFRAAEKHFHIFQQQAVRDTNMLSSGFLRQTGAHTYLHRIDDIAILALDLRSERTPFQVISKEHWSEIYDKLETLPDATRHLLVLSSIPVVHADFGLAEGLLNIWPGRQELEDDLLDHWNTEQHAEERRRFVHRLSKFCDEKRCRVTLLSGDVHIGAYGVIEDTRPTLKNGPLTMNQLTASGIVHPPPGGFARFAIERMFANGADEIDVGIVANLKPPGAGKRLFIGARNWLSLDIEPASARGRIWAKWHAEDDLRTPRTKVIDRIAKT